MTGTTDTASPAAPAYRGRFAPSPTGRLHLGSLLAALGSYLDARAAGGLWFVRIDNIDPPREEPGAADAILRSLEDHGLTWDGDVRWQQDNTARHRDAVAALMDSGFAYCCDCSRREIAGRTGKTTRTGLVYDGYCRNRRVAGKSAIRVRTEASPVCVLDRSLGELCQCLETELGDFIVWRRDGLVAYQLAVVVDDADDGITHVVRGADLWDNTPRQVWLQRQLSLPTPSYLHLPMLVGTDGDKLSKQTAAAPVARENTLRNLWNVLKLLKQLPPPIQDFSTPRDLIAWAIEHWSPRAFRGVEAVAASAIAATQNPLR